MTFKWGLNQSQSQKKGSKGNKTPSFELGDLSSKQIDEKRNHVISIADKAIKRPPVFTRPSNDAISILTQHTKVASDVEDAVKSELPEQEPVPDKNLMTSRNPSMNIWRIVSVCFWAIASGWSDAGPGALLPHIEQYYNINYTIVSMIWISNACGFITVAFLASKIQPYLGKQKSLLFGCLLSSISYAITLSGGPYGLVAASFYIGGIGLAIVLTQANVFLSKLEKQSKYLSFFHGSYGIGATISPLVATSMVNAGIKWHYFYLINLSLMTFNVLSVWIAFRGADEDLKPWDDENSSDNPNEDDYYNIRTTEVNNTSSDDSGDEINFETRKPPPHNKGQMAMALKHPVTWLISFWLLFYQGAEVSIGGWIVTFLLDYRGADNSSGYVASGFWGGLTLGRLFVTRPLHKTLGARRSVLIVSTITIALVLLTWLIPNVISAGVFVSLAGVLIGPNYSLMVTAVTQGMLPRKIQVVSLTIMTAFGSSGGAIFPFVVGLVSESAGTFVILPIFIALYTLTIVIWIMLPNVERRKAHAGGDLTLWQRFW
ncbi:MFS general substrate transporter [Hyphopichia burtonii NRRL Y-1933]|uniref:MFS general substrate transporter n=1 Tax=Hyphopichia burtonii NRRL Y-1933 TaxID=984485 RepID=A0A1E4RLJ0_9ASCO|nr:MFS general substrate transporter [Hyphopichia burtonii NRRL Y-1933]ODV68128.1 MFS general substrate transporter [Hyphopichia burtonii NRRL Y-1933]